MKYAERLGYDEGNFCQIGAFLRLLPFLYQFSLNTRLVFISYFDSVSLRKTYKGLEYECLFYRLQLLRSLLINTRLVFISYFDSIPLRKTYRGLEYMCLFYRLHLFLLHFWWLVLLSLLVFWFSCLHFWLFTLELWFS